MEFNNGDYGSFLIRTSVLKSDNQVEPIFQFLLLILIFKSMHDKTYP